MENGSEDDHRVVAFSRHDVSPTCAQRTCCGKVLSLTLRQDEREMGKAQGFRELERFLTLDRPGDILYQYVTAHISSSLASALKATKKLTSFSSGGWAVAMAAAGQAPPPGTCSSFSKCFYLLHLYPASVPVVSALPQVALQSVQSVRGAHLRPARQTDGQTIRTLTITTSLRLSGVRVATMDNSGMDSASEHSSHASSGSPAVAVKPSPSPPTNNNNPASSNHNQVHSPRQASPLGPPMSMAHPLSPPPVSSASLARSMALGHLPPPGLGLLNSLGVLHSPLDLMAHHAPPRSYNSPPPISTSDPTANECKLVDYRGQKVAAFIIAGDTMLCLPQAFELFLKHLVGGLHTVYTKLKRLDIVPLVCNVEQVRILRGLGAIQPGVNRCKLLSCKDFDTLYRDCTTASQTVWRGDPGGPPRKYLRLLNGPSRSQTSCVLVTISFRFPDADCFVCLPCTRGAGVCRLGRVATPEGRKISDRDFRLPPFGRDVYGSGDRDPRS
ncbi:hypothetical protein GEV33_013453 [Tenebrio molitor]|uniref:SKI/SNO/DAC domain-containing protein n=1 Tax=Tenebrio molitor TaxID=7067 RepID=A0A8J6H788_TENMO|nr:hypothetical protein GEV33_013453 [Tenebrio molitor]